MQETEYMKSNLTLRLIVIHFSYFSYLPPLSDILTLATKQCCTIHEKAQTLVITKKRKEFSYS